MGPVLWGFEEISWNLANSVKMVRPEFDQVEDDRGKYYMAVVKGSKQHQMVVVPHRPLYRISVSFFFVLAMAALSYFTYNYGMGQGLALKVELLADKEKLQGQLADSAAVVVAMRQEIAGLKLGGEVDSRANEEVRHSVESLQDEVALLNEEIRFYKGVMVPNAKDKGLRIERLAMESTSEPNKFKYSLLLTQVVDKHDFVQGGVEIALFGREGETDAELLLSELIGEDKKAIGFRFRYFQSINGELVVPNGFEPREVMIVARSTGNNAQRLEKTFDWQVNGG
jgi:cell division protein FtsB